MRQSFVHLVNHNWDADYAAYLNSQPFSNVALKQAAITLAGLNTQGLRKQQWNSIKQISGYAVGNDIQKLSNPYYIGFGNPDASILFVGKEKAFNLVDDPIPGTLGLNRIDKLFHESINNRFDYKSIIDHQFSKQHEFCPIYPLLNGYYTKRYNEDKLFDDGHTWRYYEYILSGIMPPVVRYERGAYGYANSLFHKSFMTELNFIPIENSAEFNWEAFNTYRRPFMRNSFYREFPVVIVNAKTHIRHQESNVISDLFNVTLLNRQALQTGLNQLQNSARFGIFHNTSTNQDEIALCPNYRNRKFPVSIYKSEDGKRYVFSVWQLSGGNAWSYQTRDRFVELINQRHIF